ncbi:hypothetical protein GCM10027064_18490 [Microbacterium petrolearium]|jgi:WXG100 family type VII secretion target
MADSIEVEIDDLETAGEDILTASETLQTDIDNLDRDLNFLRSDWTGDASDAFFASFGAWSTDMTASVATLRRIGSTLVTAAEKYSTTEDGVILECGG